MSIHKIIELFSENPCGDGGNQKGFHDGNACQKGGAGNPPSLGDRPRHKVKSKLIGDRSELEKVFKHLFKSQSFDGAATSLAGLAGADSGTAKISHYEIAAGRYSAMVETSNKKFHSRIEVMRDHQGKLFVQNNSVEIDPEFRGSGLGTDISAQQVERAAAAGASYIELFAAGSDGDPDYNGYYTWPRLGYDGPIRTRRDAEPLPESCRECKTVLDLMMTKEGREWWKKNGTAGDLRFDLTPGSRSRAILAAYLEERAARRSTSTSPKSRPATPPSTGSPASHAEALAAFEAAIPRTLGMTLLGAEKYLRPYIRDLELFSENPCGDGGSQKGFHEGNTCGKKSPPAGPAPGGNRRNPRTLRAQAEEYDELKSTYELELNKAARRHAREAARFDRDIARERVGLIRGFRAERDDYREDEASRIIPLADIKSNHVEELKEFDSRKAKERADLAASHRDEIAKIEADRDADLEDLRDQQVKDYWELNRFRVFDSKDKMIFHSDEEADAVAFLEGHAAHAGHRVGEDDDGNPAALDAAGRPAMRLRWDDTDSPR